MRGPQRPAAATALTAGAVATGVAAVTADVLAGEHVTHTIALALLVGALAMLRKRAAQFGGLLHLSNAIVVSQPALHLAGKLVGGAGGDHPVSAASHGLFEPLLPDGRTVGQVVLSLLIATAMLAFGRFADQLASSIGARIRRLLHRRAPVRRSRVHVRTTRRGSMLRWCGWELRSALRGPPCGAVPVG